MENHFKFPSESPNVESSISQDSGQLISDAFLVRITCEIVLFIRIPPCFALLITMGNSDEKCI